MSIITGEGIHSDAESGRWEEIDQRLTEQEAAQLRDIIGEAAIQAALTAEQAMEANRESEVYGVKWNDETYEVEVTSEVTREDYQESARPEDWDYVTQKAEELHDTKWVFINPTSTGGGVAMMRPPAVHLMRELGVEAHWYVMAPINDEEKSGNPFIFTKSMHNISQKMTDERITEKGKALHWQWADTENGPVLEQQESIQQADFIVIDDPQPAPLIARLKRANPQAKFIWRNHIQTDGEAMADPSSPQGEVASYLLDECGVRDVDAIMAHPVEEFVHRDRDLYDKTYFAPATFDLRDNLNRHLNEGEIVGGLEFINSEIEAKNVQLRAAGREADTQPVLSLDPTKKRITLIARFDPAKGMDKAMAMGAMVRRQMRAQGVSEAELPEVVIVGNGSVDDPDGDWMYDKMVNLKREQYEDEKGGIVIMRLKHNYDAMNALMCRSHIGMQTSDAEGLETRVSDWIKHGVPVVVSNRGGIKTQVVEGEAGIILNYDEPDFDLARGANFMASLLTDTSRYESAATATKRQAEEYNLREFVTLANVARFFRIGERLLTMQEHHADKLWKMSDITAGEV